MAQLKINAIDARLESGFRGLLLAIIRAAHWELTCGFCKERFSRTQFFALSSADCPFCGARNLLPVPRFPSDPNRRPRG